MKKPSIWAGIAGGIIIAAYLVTGAGVIAQPSDIAIVNVANLLADAAWLILGIFLVSLFFKYRNHDVAKHEPDSPEDIETLKTRRNWILAFVIVFLFLGSIGSWVVNDYAAGLTIINIEVIFDLVMNLVLLALAIQLFRGRKMLGLLFYTVIAYCSIEIIMQIIRHQWVGIFLNLVAAAYFLYSIQAPVTRKHFRIAHLVILPLFFIMSIATTPLDNIKVNNLMKQEAQLEQQFLTQSSILTNAYTSFNQKDKPESLDIQNVQDAATKTHDKIQEILSTVQAVESENGAQFPSVGQKLDMDHLEKYKVLLEAVDSEIGDIQQFMTYSNGIDFTNLSQKQKEDINAFKQKINDDDIKIADAAYKLNH